MRLLNVLKYFSMGGAFPATLRLEKSSASRDPASTALFRHP
jgi:hypothetical protein